MPCSGDNDDYEAASPLTIFVNYLAPAFLLYHFSKLSLLTLFIKTVIAFILH